MCQDGTYQALDHKRKAKIMSWYSSHLAQQQMPIFISGCATVYNRFMMSLVVNFLSSREVLISDYSFVSFSFIDGIVDGLYQYFNVFISVSLGYC